MKTFLLLLVFVCSSCVTRVERPYLKETTTEKDGRIVVREYSADRIWGTGNLQKVQVPVR